MSGFLIDGWDPEFGVLAPKHQSTGRPHVMGRLSSLQGLKVWVNKSKTWMANQGYTHVVGIGNVVTCQMTVQEFYDLRKIHHVKRKLVVELKLLEGQLDAIRRGVASVPAIQKEIVRLKQELARM